MLRSESGNRSYATPITSSRSFSTALIAASACVNTSLASNLFWPLPKESARHTKSRSGVKGKTFYHCQRSDQVISFITGQPLGLMSSWALLSLSHHVILWAAAECGRTFRDYCLLGDDIMICNKRVAEKYQEMIQKLGVDISIEKSLIWGNLLSGFLRVNCSPISPKLLLRTHHPYSLLAIYEWVTDLRILSRLQGTRFKEHCKPVEKHKRFLVIYSEAKLS